MLGNLGTSEDVDVVTRTLDDADALVPSHAAWALGRLDSPPAAAARRNRLEVEADAAVREELMAALDALRAPAAPTR